MKTVEMFETADGQLHRSVDAARKHARLHYDSQVMWVAHQLANQNFDYITAFLRHNPERFVALAKASEDLILEER